MQPPEPQPILTPISEAAIFLTLTIDPGAEDAVRELRFNMPFGRVGLGEFGTYFIGYARSPAVIEEMLRTMFIVSPPGNYDRILDFSTALTGNLFFVPTVEFLDDPRAPAVGSASEAAGGCEESEPSGGDGSLGTGSLRGRLR